VTGERNPVTPVTIPRPTAPLRDSRSGHCGPQASRLSGQHRERARPVSLRSAPPRRGAGRAPPPVRRRRVLGRQPLDHIRHRRQHRGESTPIPSPALGHRDHRARRTHPAHVHRPARRPTEDTPGSDFASTVAGAALPRCRRHRVGTGRLTGSVIARLHTRHRPRTRTAPPLATRARPPRRTSDRLKSAFRQRSWIGTTQ
jgi:hypothetical protein